jgi:hypothetical protein
VQRGQHDQREPAAVVRHHRQEDDGKQQVEHHRERVAREEGADVFQLPHARHRIAHAPGLEVLQRQAQQVSEQTGAQLHVYATGGVREYEAAQAAQRHLEYHHHREGDGDHVQGGVAAVYQHLVHHHLEKQRRNEREQLQRETHAQHLQQQAAVLHHGGNEPGEIELRHVARDGSARGKEDQFAGPLGLQGVEAEGFRPANSGRLDQGAAFVDAGEEEKTDVAGGALARLTVLRTAGPRRTDPDRRQGRLRQPRRIHAHALGHQPQFPRSQQQALRVQCTAIVRELVRDLVRVRRHAMQSGDHHQAGDATVLLGGAPWRQRRRALRARGPRGVRRLQRRVRHAVLLPRVLVVSSRLPRSPESRRPAARA